MEPQLGAVVSNFNSVAQRYFASINAQPTDRLEWLTQVESALADLYAAGLKLPSPSPINEEPTLSMSAEDVSRLTRAIDDKLGEERRVYWFVFDPLEREDPVASYLADDLASVYADIHAGVALLEAKGSLADVVWEWRFGFENHWGRHALGALQALRALVW